MPAGIHAEEDTNGHGRPRRCTGDIGYEARVCMTRFISSRIEEGRVENGECDEKEKIPMQSGTSTLLEITHC